MSPTAPTLWDPLPPVLPPFAPGSGTSRKAAEMMEKSGKRQTQKGVVLAYITSKGRYGATRNEINRDTGILIQSLCGRLALFMMHQIRFVMTPGGPAPTLTGTVEADETFVGGKPRLRERKEWSRLKREGVQMRRAKHNKTPVMAMIERGGDVRAVVLADVTARNVRQTLLANVSPDAHLRTDEARQYVGIGRRFASHESVKHSLYEFVKGDASTNAAESFFARLKRQLYGTHHAVSKRHLHRYVSEVVFKHNTRKLDDGQRVLAALRMAEGKRLMYQDPIRKQA